MHAAAAVLQEYIYALDVTPFCMWSSWNVLCCSCVSYMALKLLYTGVSVASAGHALHLFWFAASAKYISGVISSCAAVV